MYPIIFTSYNQVVDPIIAQLQGSVIEKFRNGIPFLPLNYGFTEDILLHGDILNKAIHKVFYEIGADSIFIMDVDAIPLSTESIEETLHLAYQGHLVGNIQRSNHLNNNQHVYVGSSYLCFTRETFERAGSPTMCYNNTYDTVEIFSVNAEKIGIPITKFMPIKVDSPWTGSDGVEGYWDLADGMPQYGIGTTFEYNNKPMSYHLFCSRVNTYNKFFIDKCNEILNQNL